MQLFGARGAIVFDQERFNEVGLVAEGPEGAQGFKQILMGPAHPPYERFIVASGHQMGFNDLKIIEAHELLNRIAGRPALTIDFEAGLAIERTVHAIAALEPRGTLGLGRFRRLLELRAEPLHSRAKRRERGRDHRNIVDRHRLKGRQPHDEKAHRDPGDPLGRDQPSAPRPPALDDQVIALDGAVDLPAALSPAATAARRSLSLTLSSCKPRMRVEPEANAAATDRIGYSSIIEGARAAGTSTPLSVPARTLKSATFLAALDAFVERLDMRPHLLQRLEELSPERVHHHPLNDDVGPRNDQSGDEGDRRRRWVARNHHGRRTCSGRPTSLILVARFPQERQRPRRSK